ncbi:MAG: hypothetical protein V3S55_07755 [Nitrospiraceae bacterium]
MRFLVITMAVCLLCLTVPVAHANYDEEECSGNGCDAPPEGGSVGDVTAEGGDATATAFGGSAFSSSGSSIYAPDYSFDYNPSSASSNSSANALSFQEQYNSMYQGQGQGFEAFNGNTTTTIVNPDLGEGIKEAAKVNVRRANRAPRPAAAVADHCDTGGFTVQTGPVGGGTSSPTFPCEVQRTKETLDKLGSGWFDQYVTKPLLHGRLIFKGLFSWVPIIGS